MTALPRPLSSWRISPLTGSVTASRRRRHTPPTLQVCPTCGLAYAGRSNRGHCSPSYQSKTARRRRW